MSGPNFHDPSTAPAPALCPLNGKHCLTRAEAKTRLRAMRSTSMLLPDRRLELYKCPVWRSHPDQTRLFHIGHGKPRRRRR